MGTYDGILVRSNLNDKGSIPRTGSWTGSPDIIGNGNQPQDNAVQHFTDNFDEYVSNDQIVQDTVNIIYLRGKKYGALDVANSEARLFYAPAGIILYPMQWLENQLGNSDGTVVLPVTTVANDVYVTATPFTWTPDITGHCCFVGFISTPGGANDFANQKPPGSVASIQELGAWIQSTGGTGWHNVDVVSVGKADFTRKMPPIDVGSEGASFRISLFVNNAPAGSFVSFSSTEVIGSGPDKGKYVNMEKIEVPTDGTGLTIKRFLPAGFIGNIQLSYWAGSPKAGLEFSIEAMIVDTGSTVDEPIRKHGIPLEELRPNMKIINEESGALEPVSKAGAVLKGIIVGNYTIKTG